MAGSKPRISTDTLIVVLLFALLLVWGPLYVKFFGRAPRVPPAEAVEPGLVHSNELIRPPPGTSTSPAEGEAAREQRAIEEARPAAPVQVFRAVREAGTLALSNADMTLTASAYGACVLSAELKHYPLTWEAGSGPVCLDFRELPALVYEGLAGLDGQAEFQAIPAATPGDLRLAAETPQGLRLERTLRLQDSYRVMVEDVFSNRGSAPVVLPDHGISLGAMGRLEGEHHLKGMEFLAIDTLASTGGEAVRHWGRKRFLSRDVTLSDLFQEPARRGGGCARAAMTRPLPSAIREPLQREVDWAAVKNKFFVQILAPVGGADGCELMAERVLPPGEEPSDPRTWAQVAELARVAAMLRFRGCTLGPGATLRREFSYYVGPKELASLRALGAHQKEVMDFGTWRWLCEGLVWTLRVLHGVVGNYGLAIILLTVLLRLVFWPVTHRGTESMKRMQELQPKLKELQAKYKSDPREFHRRQMELFREHRVNPMGGCLPMLVQLPVFFALYIVLRSAVELRFARFLWIRDLSAPENLLAGHIPLVGALNLLPILTAVTQAWQTKLTPSSGDSSQQRMMMLMPIVLIFVFYTMPAALNLYWTSSQMLMIIQLLWQRRGTRGVASGKG